MTRTISMWWKNRWKNGFGQHTVEDKPMFINILESGGDKAADYDAGDH